MAQKGLPIELPAPGCRKSLRQEKKCRTTWSVGLYLSCLIFPELLRDKKYEHTGKESKLKRHVGYSQRLTQLQ